MDVLVSIIIPNYNGKKFITPCLSSLNRQSFKDFEVILVDNDSSDGSVDFVKDTFPTVKIVRNHRNLGYAGGWNSGIEISRGKYLVSLNNDIELDTDWLKELVKSVEKNPSVGICTSKVLRYDDREIINSCGVSLDVYGGTWLIGECEKDYGQYDGKGSREVFSAYGASILVRRQVLDKIGAFDDDFFAYYEETDFCWRTRLYGYKVLYVPTSKAYHMGGMTAGRRSAQWEKGYFYFRNKINSLIKNYEAKNALKRLPIVLFTHFLHSILYSLTYCNIEPLRYFIRAVVWNLKILRTTIKKRKKIQAYRTVSDKDIEELMYSFPLWLLKRAKMPNYGF